MHDLDIFTQLSIIIVFVAIVSMIAKLLKQPLILGYIVTGLILGPSLLDLIPQNDTFATFSTIGIAQLLFIIGLGLNAAVFRKLGKVVVLTALMELIVVGSVGFFIAAGFGFSFTEALLIGLALFFSSTIIIVKMLSDKKEQSRLHGQIAIGVILLDDIIATIALLFIAAGEGGGFGISELGILFIKGVVLAALLYFISTKVLPRLTKQFASSQELLYIFTLAWGFGVATVFEKVGFSIEVGALFAGVALATLPYAQEMASRLKPLRDFFVVLFFITLGGSLDIQNLAAGIIPAIILSAVVIFLKPLSVMVSLGLFGYTKRTSFKTGINLSQISEFSIILIVLAAASGLVRPEISAIITLVAIITIATSTYLMQYDNAILLRLERRFRFFKEQFNHAEEEKTINNHALILFGYKKGGHEFVKTFKQMRKRYIVVDYNPTVIESLEHQRIPYLYGDATDVELLREIGIKNSHLIVSTITDYSTNEQLLRYIHRINPHVVTVFHADNYEEATSLYRHGATYVMLPHYISSERISAFIKKHGTSKKAFVHYRQKHLMNLGRTALK